MIKNTIVAFALGLLSLFSYGQNRLGDFTRIRIDSTQVKWGDYAKPEWLRYFGVDAADINNDGYLDVLAGRSVYLNPGGQMQAGWQKIDLGANVDGFAILDVDGDAYADIIAMALPDIYWYEAQNKQGTKWKGEVVAQVPATSHVNSQGYRKYTVSKEGSSFLIAGDGNVYHIASKLKKGKVEWITTLIGANTSDEGIGLGDLDGDGDLDIATGRRAEGAYEPLELVWFENPGDASGDWKSYSVAKTSHPIDRIEIGDVNGDGKAEIVLAEERYPGLEPDGNIFWYQYQESPQGKWQKHWIITQYSSNNLDLADMDADGDLDVVTNEHKGPHLKTQIWDNDGEGKFTENIIEKGAEAHLGAQVFDLDNDGDLDIVSIGWDTYQNVHIWRNNLVNTKNE